MKAKLLAWAGAAAGAVALFATGVAHAAVAAIVIPTSTAADISANAGAQLGDPGTLTVLEWVGGAIFVFWLIHQLLGLIPRSRGGRRS
jgi:hypothetical protein